MKDQVLVIGSGVAALMAALEAKRVGQEVTLVVSRPGASALVGGSWDVAPDPQRPGADRWRDFKPAREI